MKYKIILDTIVDYEQLENCVYITVIFEARDNVNNLIATATVNYDIDVDNAAYVEIEYIAWESDKQLTDVEKDEIVEQIYEFAKEINLNKLKF